MSIDWHPRKSLLASGSKDTQQPVKLWDPKAGQSIATMLVLVISVPALAFICIPFPKQPRPQGKRSICILESEWELVADCCLGCTDQGV